MKSNLNPTLITRYTHFGKIYSNNMKKIDTVDRENTSQLCFV